MLKLDFSLDHASFKPNSMLELKILWNNYDNLNGKKNSNFIYSFNQQQILLKVLDLPSNFFQNWNCHRKRHGTYMLKVFWHQTSHYTSITSVELHHSFLGSTMLEYKFFLLLCPFNQLFA
jgi:hypothetical protein